MTDHDFTQLRYWFDLMIKALIGVVVSIVGMDYRAVKNSLQELENHKYQMVADVSVFKTEVVSLKDRLDRIEKKLDRALDK